MKDRAKGTGGSAVSERDPHDVEEKTKKEFPEAPDGPVLGMQDERGGKGQ